MDWYMKVIKDYTKFDGRARRREFWTFALINFGISIVLSFLEGMIGLTYILTTLYGLAVLLPSLAVGARRLHDTGKSAVWLFIGLIPFIGAIVLLVLFVGEGQQGPNEYGPDPKGSEEIPAI